MAQNDEDDVWWLTGSILSCSSCNPYGYEQVLNEKDYLFSALRMIPFMIKNLS